MSSTEEIKQKRFLLKLLIRQDLKGRYSKTDAGVLWRVLSPFCFFLVQALVFTFFFSRGEHYISYLITGNIVFYYFADTTADLMHSLDSNSGIISKIKVNKDIFLFSKSISGLIIFLITILIMFAVTAYDHITFRINFFLLIYPAACLFFLNLGVGYILSAMYVFFKNTQYLYSIFTRVLVYFSALFYYTDRLPANVHNLFFCNPVYCYIYYFRSIIVYDTVPSIAVQVLCIGYPIVFMMIGKTIYRLNDNKFVYYF